jgi:6,7-dimethyl-8-ribityllumazine synthase
MSTSDGSWPGETPPPAPEQDDVEEPDAHAAVVDPPRWPGARDETSTAQAAPAVAEPTEPEQAEPEQMEPEPAAVAEPVPAAEPAEPADEEPEPVPVGHVPGEIDIPDGVAVLEGSPSGADRTVGLVVSRFNGEISNRLLESALEALAAAGVPEERITVMPVPGAFELPIGAMALAKTRRYSCVIAIGCVVRGETAHFEYVAGEAASGLQLAGLETGVPVAFGVLTVDTAEQAEARIDKGADAARAALEMADLFSQVRKQARAG